MSRIIGVESSTLSNYWSLRTQQILKKGNVWPTALPSFRLIEDSPVSIRGDNTTLNFNPVFREGDLVFIIAFDEDGVVANTPAGWTSLYSDSGDGIGSKVVYKFMGETPDSSVSELTSLGADGGYFSFAFRNATSIPTNNFSSDSLTSTIDFPTVSSILAGDIVIAIALNVDTTRTLSVPEGYTVIIRAAVGSDTAGMSFMAAYIIRTTGGTENPTSISTATSLRNYHAYTIALRS